MRDEHDDRDTRDRIVGLDHERRRYGLYCLSTHRSMTLADLADEVAVWEHESPLTSIPAEGVAEVYLSLYHSHIPALEDHNLVTYYQERDLVAITARGEAVSSAADLMDAYSPAELSVI